MSALGEPDKKRFELWGLDWEGGERCIDDSDSWREIVRSCYHESSDGWRSVWVRDTETGQTVLRRRKEWVASGSD